MGDEKTADAILQLMNGASHQEALKP